MNEYLESIVDDEARQARPGPEESQGLHDGAVGAAEGPGPASEGPAPEPVPAEQEATASEPGGLPNRRVEAGRKGARRIHQLIERGKRYEQEHGLKGGRQRLRQLIEEGKLYEREHGLDAGGRRARAARPSREEVVKQFLESLVQIVKPAYRPHLGRLLRALEEQGE